MRTAHVRAFATAMCVMAAVAAASAQTTYRYVRFTTLDCSGEKYQELDWFDEGVGHPTPKMTSVTSNGMHVWGDNADWEIVQVYDGDPATHAWLGDIAPPYTHEVYLDLGSGNGIYPDSIRITKPGYTSVRHFQCWASNDAVDWDLFLDTVLTSPQFSVRSFPLTRVADTEEPSAPSGLTASNVTSNSTGLYWQAAVDNRGVYQYRVYRDGVAVDSTPNTSLVVSGLSAASSYAFHVTALDRAGNESASSDTVQVTTGTSDSDAPASPTGLSVTATTSTRADISWTPSAEPDIAGYVVYLDGSPVGTTDATVFSIPGLAPSTTYDVTLRARDVTGNASAPAAAVQAATQAAGTPTMSIGTNFWNVAWGGAASDPFGATHQAVVGDNPWKVDLLTEIQPYVTLRFMDWGAVNNTAQNDWNERAQRADLIQNPVAFEWMIDLCNRSGKNLWLCIPHPLLSRDTLERGANDYVRKLALLVKHGVDMRDIDLDQPQFADLDEMTRRELVYAGGVPTCMPLKPHLQYYIEYSNETWNFGFTQARYCVNEGQALGLGGPDEYYEGRRFHAWAALRVFEETEDVFGAGNPRLVRIDAIHTGGNTHIADHLVVYDSPVHNPRGIYPDAFSPAPYFGHSVDGAAGNAVSLLHDAIVTSANNSRSNKTYIDSAGANRGRVFRHIAYEGGQHVTTNADVINRSVAMYDLYIAYLDSMGNYYDEFCHYAHAGTFGSGGAWGAKESFGQDIADAHKYRALVGWLGLPTPGLVDFFPPSVPAGLSLVSATSTQLALSWTASTDVTGVDGYQVYQNGFYVGYTTSPGYTAGGLSPECSYEYSLKAVDVLGNVSRMSDTLSASTTSLAVELAARRAAQGVLRVQRAAGSGALVLYNAAGAARVEVYSMSGRRVVCVRNVTSNHFALERSRVGRGVFLVVVTGRDGSVRTRTADIR